MPELQHVSLSGSDKAFSLSRKFFNLLLLLLIAERITVLVLFSFHWTTNDDLFFWLSTRDFAHGEFHGPFMYGQDYNFTTESLGAVPLAWCGVPYHIALPIVTSLMALFPFYTFARYFREQGHVLSACFILAVPLLLPPEWGMMTSMPRGFINGLFFLGFLPLVSALRNRWLADGLYALFAAVAVVINPGAILLAVPLLILHGWPNMRDKWYYLRMALGALPAVPLYVYSENFIAANKQAFVHTVFDWRMEFHPAELIPEALQRLDFMFMYLAPLSWHTGSVIVIATVLLTGWLFFRKAWPQAVALLAALLLTLLAFGFPKMQDGTISPLYCESRHFLAFPILFAVFVAYAVIRYSKNKIAFSLLGAAVLGSVIFKVVDYKKTDEHALAYSRNLPVDVYQMKYVRTITNAVYSVAQREKADFVVSVFGGDPALFVTTGSAQLLTTGAELMHPDFPPNCTFNYERRFWLLPNAKAGIYKRILIAGRKPDQIPEGWMESGKLKTCSEDPRLYLLQNDGMRLDSVIAKLYKLQ